MEKDNITIDGFTIHFGRTTVKELLNHGYTVSDFEQIIEEPTLATCNLYKGTNLIAILSFYNIKEIITIDRLNYIPIDLVLLHSKKHKKNEPLTQKKAFKRRISLSLLIHLIAASIFFCTYSIPALFSWVQNTTVSYLGGPGVPIGMVLLILPALIITFIWGAVETQSKPGITKLLLSLGLILNVIISLTYLILIHNAFTHAFF